MEVHTASYCGLLSYKLELFAVFACVICFKPKNKSCETFVFVYVCCCNNVSNITLNHVRPLYLLV